MPQSLELLNRGDRFAPTVYRFGANERLNIHCSDQYADLTDAKTGACIRIIGWQGLRDMGYSPAKLLEGNESDQFYHQQIRRFMPVTYTKHTIAGVVCAAAIAIVGSLTGCNGFITSQIEQDVATSTIETRLSANSVNQDDLDDDAQYFASKQYRDAKRANDLLASVRRRL
jgi:hypothetical protein